MHSHNQSHSDLTSSICELTPVVSADESLDVRLLVIKLQPSVAVDQSMPDITALQLPISTSSTEDILPPDQDDISHLQIAQNVNSFAITFDNFLNQLTLLQNQGIFSYRKKEEAQLRLRLCRQYRTCAICHELVKKKSVIYQLKCKHVFHRECLNRWRKIKDNCPLCRKQLS